MAFYRDRVLPHLVHWAMRQRELVAYRERIVGEAEGRVLEIGVGSGLNLPFYPARTHRIIGLEPSPPLMARARTAPSAARPIVWIEGSAEDIPLEDGSVDTVISTWTLCSIPDVARALGEIRRVLTPSGRLLFVEHGLAPDEAVRRWQDRLTPVWKRAAGGCHLNRPIDRLIEGAGLEMVHVSADYMPGPRILTFMYEGCAKPR